MTVKCTVLELRQAALYSQVEVAAALDVSVVAVANWEHDRTRMTLTHKRLVCELFGVKADGVRWPKEGEGD